MKIEHKTFDSEIKAADDSTLTIEHWISTDEKDRGGDQMVPEGMIIKGRPVVLLAHGRGNMSSEPVAKPLDIRVESYRGRKGVVAKTQFYPDAVGQRLYEKVRDGFMPNFSIGYGVIKSEDIFKDGKFDARLVSKWELYEYSLVSVPMCAGATTFKDGEEALSFKLLPDDDAEECCGECQGDVKCAGHREKVDPPKPGECPTCKATLTTFTKDGDNIGIACEKCEPEKFAELTKAIAPPELPPPEKASDGMESRMAAMEKQMTAMEKKMADCEAMCMKCEAAMQAMADAMKNLEPLLKTLPPEPDGGKEGDEEHHDNPPEKKTPPRLVVVRDDVTPDAEKQAARARILAIAREVINEAAKQEIDRMKGRVP
jgi:hypothetical protein